jgi:hypothetical protein
VPGHALSGPRPDNWRKSGQVRTWLACPTVRRRSTGFPRPSVGTSGIRAVGCTAEVPQPERKRAYFGGLQWTKSKCYDGVFKLWLDVSSRWHAKGQRLESLNAIALWRRGRVRTSCTSSRRPRGAARAADTAGTAELPLRSRSAGLRRRSAARSKERVRRNPRKARTRGGFDTGTPRGGSIGLIRATWKAARSQASVQPPPPCKIRRSVSRETGRLPCVPTSQLSRYCQEVVDFGD